MKNKENKSSNDAGTDDDNSLKESSKSYEPKFAEINTWQEIFPSLNVLKAVNEIKAKAKKAGTEINSSNYFLSALKNRDNKFAANSQSDNGNEESMMIKELEEYWGAKGKDISAAIEKVKNKYEPKEVRNRIKLFHKGMRERKAKEAAESNKN